MSDLFNLSGKTALITGASSGLGERFVRCLSEAGTRVILIARRKELIDKIASQLPNAHTVECDVSDQTMVAKVFNTLQKNGEKIDICINNAGIARLTNIFEENNDNLEDQFKTNVFGLWYVTKQVANHMKQNNIHGSIINIASVGGDIYSRRGLEGYCASKAAVIKLTKSLVGALSEYNIRINAISPGVFETPMTQKRLSSVEGKHELEHKVPLKTSALPSDLDGILLCLASNKASRYVTGSIITVDGGISWGG